MSSWFSFGVSCLALLVSGITAWFTLFRKGRLKMTQPTVIFFGPDASRVGSLHNKVYLRTLLYSTAKRGQVLESLHISLQRNESKQNFNIWVYGEKGNLRRGSGLFVPQEGVAFDHHFVLPDDGANFDFLSGTYKLMVFAKLVGARAPKELAVIDLGISESQAEQLAELDAGIYFDWGPDQQNYHAHIENRPEDRLSMDKLLNLVATKND